MTHLRLSFAFMSLALSAGACAESQNFGVTPDAVEPDSGRAPTVTGDAGNHAHEDAATNTGTVDAAADATKSTASKIVIFGGTDGLTTFSDTWTFDGTAWTQVNGTGPGARSSAAMATLGNKVILFGGSTGPTTSLQETWAFDGTSWAQIPTTSAPSSGSGMMATLNDKLVYFGGVGTDAVPFVNETWTFDGSDWTKLNVSGPSGRYATSMATNGGKVLLFGGETTTNPQTEDGFNDETWLFDGTSWSQVTTTGPSRRILDTLAPIQQGFVLFGGRNEDVMYDTWLFDGTSTWSQLGITGPSTGGMSSAALNGKVVVFGGLDPNTWIFDGSTWTTVDFTASPVIPSARTAVSMATLVP